MRAPLLATLLLAGCVGHPFPPDRHPPEGLFDPVAFPDCARLLVLPEAETFRAYRWLRIDLAFENCGDARVEVENRDLCTSGALNVTVERGGVAYVLRQSSLTLGGSPKHVCGDVMPGPREVPPGTWLNETVHWNGTIIDRFDACASAPCDPRMGARPAEAGVWRVVATAITPRGLVMGEANLTLTPPAVPTPHADPDVRFVMNETYRVGDEVAVRLENVGERAYRYRTHYAACDLEYYTDEGRPFLVPEGTHCDLANADAVRPGETVLLFNWSLDECTLDVWGCGEKRPLPPGTYHLRGRFHPDDDGWWRRTGDFTYAGWTVRIVP